MTNQEVVYLANVLKEVDAPEMEPSFNYAISATLSDAIKISEDIKKALVPTEEFSQLEKDLQGLREKHAEKDEEGKPKTVTFEGGMKQYVIVDAEKPTSPFGKAVAKLQEKYKEAIKKRDEQLDFITKENEDFEPHKITVDQIPKGLSRAAMDAVFMITEKI